MDTSSPLALLYATDAQGPAVIVTTADNLPANAAWIYDPAGELPSREQTIRWSPLQGCRDADYAWSMAAWLLAGTQKIDTPPELAWVREVFQLLVAPLLYCAASTGQSVLSVRDCVYAGDLTAAYATLRSIPAGDHAAIRSLQLLNTFEHKPEKVRLTIFSTAARVFSAFHDSATAESAVRPTFDAAAMVRGGHTLYAVTPRVGPQRVYPLLVGIVMATATAALKLRSVSPDRRHDPLVHFELSELPCPVPLAATAARSADYPVLRRSVAATNSSDDIQDSAQR